MSFRAQPEDGVAFVTGASSGIGRAVALLLAERGFTVAASARRAAELDELAAQHPRIFSFPGDVADRAENGRDDRRRRSRAWADRARLSERRGLFPAERDGFDVEVAWRSFEVNVGGTINCLGPLLERMKRGDAGRSRFTSSLAGYGGIPGSIGYGASKAALIYMAETLRMTAPAGLTIQIVNPGFVETPMTAPNKDFDMPFIMGADRAAKIICDGFRKRRL